MAIGLWSALPIGRRPGTRMILVEEEYDDGIDTTLPPPETQYGATRGNPEQRNPSRNAVIATPCTPL